MKYRGVALATLVLIVSACTSLKPQKYLQKEEAIFSLRLEQGACFGTCPVFNLDIAHTGKATLESIRFLPKEGMIPADLPQAEIDSLKLMLRETAFFELDSMYDNPGLSDLAKTKISVKLGKQDQKTKTVIGRFETPENFDKLVGFLNRLRMRNF